MPYLAYPITILLYFLQIPLNAGSALPPQGMVLAKDLLSSPTALLSVSQFFILSFALTLFPIWVILKLHKHDPKSYSYSRSKYVAVGLSYVLLWHILIAVINAILTPRSDWAVGIYYNSNKYFNYSIIIGVCVIYIALLFRTLLNRESPAFRFAIFAIPALLLAVNIDHQEVIAQSNTNNKPNIILIGVDSLSAQQYEAYKDSLPNIRKFTENSSHFIDTLTPLGRTFTAWSSILSGKYPRETGSRDNLIPLNTIDSSDFLPNILKSSGYQTIFAMDERQFSNIDKTWGFQSIVGPDVGAADFIISAYSDIPIVNIIVASWPSLAEKLFPYTTYNRAAWKTYFPDRFNSKLSRVIAESNNAPLFLAVHFCIAHTPFKWGDIQRHEFDKKTNIGNQRHFNAIYTADQQVGSLLDTLKKTGRLENAIIVLLSDHGEGLGYTTRNFTAELNIPAPNEVAHKFAISGYTYGHGSNLLEPELNQTILAINHYIHGKPKYGPTRQDTPAILVDLAPTILDLAGLHGESLNNFSGTSLAPYIRNPLLKSPSRPRYLETGLSPGALNAEVPSREMLLETMATYFQISQSGKVEIKESSYGEVIKAKRIAVVFENWQLTLYPPSKSSTPQILFNRDTGHWTDNRESPLWHEAGANELIKMLNNFYDNDDIDALHTENSKNHFHAIP